MLEWWTAWRACDNVFHYNFQITQTLRMRMFPEIFGLVAERDTYLGTSKRARIDLPVIDVFVAVAGDRQWLHVDLERQPMFENI